MDNHGVEEVDPSPPIPQGHPHEKKDEEVYCYDFPPGVRFSPTDEELIGYLRKKVHNEKQSCDHVIHEVKLEEHHPSELLGRFPAGSTGTWYFFSPRDRKYANGLRPDRAAKGGFWKPTGADKPIGRSKGYKKNLVFCEGTKKQHTITGWMMVEYWVPESRVIKEKDSKRPRSKKVVREKRDMLLDIYVLCKIFYKESKRQPDSKRREGPTESVPQGNSAATPLPSSGLEHFSFDQSNRTAGLIRGPPMVQELQHALMHPNTSQMLINQQDDAPLRQAPPHRLHPMAMLASVYDRSMPLHGNVPPYYPAMMDRNTFQQPINQHHAASTPLPGDGCTTVTQPAPLWCEYPSEHRAWANHANPWSCMGASSVAYNMAASPDAHIGCPGLLHGAAADGVLHRAAASHLGPFPDRDFLEYIRAHNVVAPAPAPAPAAPPAFAFAVGPDFTDL